jgi:AcrR family transcriptional regulator
VSIEPLTRARRREMTRRHLIDAAAAVFARDGFHGASLDDVAATAGFTKGAVYSNFASKDDLFIAVFEHRQEREEEEMQRTLTESEQPYEMDDQQMSRVRSVIDRTWDDEWTALYLEFVLYARRNPEAQRKLAAAVQRQREATIAMLQEAYAGVGGEPDLPVPTLATLSVALFDGLALGRLADPPAFDERLLAEALAFLVGAIGINEPPEGEE